MKWRSGGESEMAGAFSKVSGFAGLARELAIAGGAFQIDMAGVVGGEIYLFELKSHKDRNWLTRDSGVQQFQNYVRFANYATYIVDISMLQSAQKRLPSCIGLIGYSSGELKTYRQPRRMGLRKHELASYLSAHHLKRLVRGVDRRACSLGYGELIALAVSAVPKDVLLAAAASLIRGRSYEW